MADDMKDLKRADNAKRIMDNPVWKEWFDAEKEAIISAMVASAIADQVTHNKLVIALQTLYRQKSRMVDYINTGKMVEIQAKEGVVQKLRRVSGF